MCRILVGVAALLALSVGMPGQTGRRAPGFSLPDTNRQLHDLQDYRGKVVVLEIMSSGCPHCADFSKTLEQVKAKYAGKVAVLGITNPPDTPQNLSKFVAEHRTTYPILYDCGQVSYSYVLPSPLHPTIAIPHVYLIDRNGMIRGDYEYGSASPNIFQGDALSQEIDKVLAAGAKR